MKRAFAGLIATLGLVAATFVGGVATAEPAEAACPTALIIPHDVTWGSQYVGTDTRVIRCDNGTATTSDDYYRLDWWRYTDSSDIRRTFGFNSVGNPVMQWQADNGALCNRINGYSEWRVGGVDFIDLGNQKCNWPVLFTVIGRADRILQPDSNFSHGVWR